MTSSVALQRLCRSRRRTLKAGRQAGQAGRQAGGREEEVADSEVVGKKEAEQPKAAKELEDASGRRLRARSVVLPVGGEDGQVRVCWLRPSSRTGKARRREQADRRTRKLDKAVKGRARRRKDAGAGAKLRVQKPAFSTNFGARRLGACDPHRIMSLTALIEEAMALDAANSAAVR